MNGAKVGEDDTNKFFQAQLSSYRKTSLTEGSCESVNWAKKYFDWKEHDGVIGSLWDKAPNQATIDAEKKKVAEKAAADKKAANAKNAAESKKAAEKAAAEKTAAEKKAKEAAMAEYDGVGHFILSSTKTNGGQVCM